MVVLDAKPHGQTGKDQIHPEDAMRFIVDALAKNSQEFKSYGYDLYVINAVERFVTDLVSSF